MALTPNGSLTSYATGANMLDHYDLRTVADLVSDTGARLSGTTPNATTVAASSVLGKLLNAAAGMIESACLRGKRYQAVDLNGLTGVAKDFLIQLNCDLAMGLLYRRRPDKGALPPFYLAALEWLKMLASGESIFPFAESQEAGLPSVVVDQYADVENRALVAQQAKRFYGTRADELNPHDATAGNNRWDGGE